MINKLSPVGAPIQFTPVSTLAAQQARAANRVDLRIANIQEVLSNPLPDNDVLDDNGVSQGWKDRDRAVQQLIQHPEDLATDPASMGKVYALADWMEARGWPQGAQNIRDAVNKAKGMPAKLPVANTPEAFRKTYGDSCFDIADMVQAPSQDDLVKERDEKLKEEVTKELAFEKTKGALL